MLQFPIIKDHRGNLSFVEGSEHIPFDIARVYYLYDVPHDAERGGHAHKELQQVIIAMSGSYVVELDNGTERKDVLLNNPRMGLYLNSMTWRVLKGFSSGSVCVVLASQPYIEDDYIRDYDDFLRAAKRNG